MLNHDHGFDVGAGGAPVMTGSEELSPYEVFQRIGELTRKLHDALHALGYHKNIEQAVGALPDARARLDYIAEVTGKSADKVLTAAENGRSVQEALGADAGSLIDVWNRAGNKPNAILVCRGSPRHATVRRSPKG